MTGWKTLMAILGVAASAISGCSSDADQLSVESKEMCIAETSSRLIDCQQDAECEKGVVRFAGYCYNTAHGNQLDICRGGSYFFYQPLKKLAENHTVISKLDKHQREIVIRTGEVYCNYNFN